MELLLKRIARKDTYTIGKLYCNNVWICDTIEDCDRLYFSKPKVMNETAIPCGRYEIVQNIKSPRFGEKSPYKDVCAGFVPRLVGVPNFTGILIHVGNTAKDSSGCILLGKNKKVGKVIESKETWTMFMRKYMLPAKKRKEQVFITIK